jgi:hypothetical protein
MKSHTKRQDGNPNWPRPPEVRDNPRMRAHFCGTRGSTSVSGPEQARCGGSGRVIAEVGAMVLEAR